MEKQHSRYYQYGVEETVKQYIKNFYFNKIIFVLILLADLVWLLMHGKHDIKFSFLQYAILFCIFIVYSCIYYTLFPGLAQILMTDCDPYKFYEVLQKLDKYARKGKSNNNLLFYKAACCIYIPERIEEGLSYLKKINFTKKVLAREARVLLLFANYSKTKKDRGSFERIKKDLELLPNMIAHKKREKKEYNDICKFFQVVELMWNEEDKQARKLINELLLEEKTVLNRVIFNMYLARLDVKANEKSNAKVHLEYVITHGGKMIITEEAKALLENLDRE